MVDNPIWASEGIDLRWSGSSRGSGYSITVSGDGSGEDSEERSSAGNISNADSD